MAEKRLGIAQRATLLILMGAGKSLTNKEIHAVGQFTPLTGKDLQPLYDLKLLETDRKSSGHVHSLTLEGWLWCERELSAGVGGKYGSAGGALYGVLAGLGRFLERSTVSLKDIFLQLDEPTIDLDKTVDVEGLIRRAYVKLRTEPRGWVSLTKLRPLLVGYSKNEVDTVLNRMNRTKGVNIIPESNQSLLSAEDRKAMILIGNEDRLLLSIDEP